MTHDYASNNGWVKEMIVQENNAAEKRVELHWQVVLKKRKEQTELKEKIADQRKKISAKSEDIGVFYVFFF